MRFKLDLRWRLGICVGHSNNTNEYYVAPSNGNVVKARSVVQVLASRRWCGDSVEKITGIPGDMIVNGEADPTAGIEEAIDPHAMLDADLEVGDAVPEARDSKMQSNMDKQIRITMKDLETYGYTPGCQRSSDLQKKKHRTNKHHNAGCGTRMYLRSAAKDASRRCPQTMQEAPGYGTCPPCAKPPSVHSMQSSMHVCNCCHSMQMGSCTI